LHQLPFANKDDVLMAIKTDKGCDDVREKIESVLKHIKTLNANSDKFINAHKSFKQEVGARFEQFEQRLQTLDTKLNTLQCAAPTQAVPGVVFPRDVTKHQHLAVFMGRVEEQGSTQIAFARGQDEHFRKRKLEFEDDMDTMFEGVHPNPLMAVHCLAEAAELEILPGVFFSASKQNLDTLVAQTEQPYKIIIGNSGWGAGQLENELQEGAWLSTPATAEYLFHDSTELWNLVSRQIGRSMLESMLKIKEIPDDPRMN
jgi:putative AlgH/UPF0301 family transcriptional regulator/chaperonin cofactor prefoldin